MYNAVVFLHLGPHHKPKMAQNETPPEGVLFLPGIEL
jgi:hypothetical protein